MKKRFLCALLTLIMLVSLVPATALTASAAGYTTSEAAITVLKQLEGYHDKCSENGYTGYGTRCEVKATHKGQHTISERQADQALRAALKELDAAITGFASNNGLALSQNQHDALVLFSFQNGTAWTTGSGDFRAAVVNRLTGAEFLNAICRWDSRINDDQRRMVEANMYLNGAYSSWEPSNYIRVDFNTNGGSMNGKTNYQYYDTSANSSIGIVPSHQYYTFLGWYWYNESGKLVPVSKVSSKFDGATLIARWQTGSEMIDCNPSNTTNGSHADVYYEFTVADMAENKVLNMANGDMSLNIELPNNKTLIGDRDFVDQNGSLWLRLRDYNGGWVRLGKKVATNTGSVSKAPEVDVTVTVTNSYVRARTEDSIYSTQNGTYYQGNKLRIINTSQADGFLWGQVAKSATDSTPICWVALMYTNWESVKGQNNVNNSTVVAKATVTINGYVNVRNGAGTNNKLVGSLPNGITVDLYETKFVNGHEWGRCSTGWFNLSYAKVERLVESSNASTDVGLISYVFTGKVNGGYDFYKDPADYSADPFDDKPIVDPFMSEALPADGTVTINQLKLYNGVTWGKTKFGWIRVSDANGDMLNVDLHEAKFVVTADTLTVREKLGNNANRVDTLVKGVEFIVNPYGGKTQILVYGDSVWARAYKVGEDRATYNGWVNLANSNVTRNEGASLDNGNTDNGKVTGLMATVINTDNVNVREYNDATYAKIGSLARGTTVAVWEEEDGWYKIDSNRNGKYDYEGDGWVSAKYLNIYEAEDNSSDATGNAGTAGSASGNVETGLGIVANTYTGVNVRSGAGVGYAPKGKILAGSTVEILEVKPVGNSKWGRVAQGWICMDYVTMVQYYQIAGSASSSNGTAGTTSSTTTATEAVVFTGWANKNGVKVYKTTEHDEENLVRVLNQNDPVTIHELLTVQKSTSEATDPENPGGSVTVTTVYENWARINDGYIYSPGDDVDLEALNEYTYTVTGVKGDEPLNVREWAGDGAVLDKVYEYQIVSITSLDIYKGSVWGRAEYVDEEGYNQEGWVNMSYLTRGTVTKPVQNNTNNNTNNNNTNNNTNTGNSNNVIIGSSGNTANQGNNGYVNNAAGYRYKGNIIRTGSVNVRANPSQTAGLMTTLKQGAALVIYETTINEGMAWGRCDAGWVYLYYVDLQPCNNAVDAKVVYNENTIIYTDANCSGVAGTYSRMSVVDIYEQVGSMCRTEQGWVHIDNLG